MITYETIVGRSSTRLKVRVLLPFTLILIFVISAFLATAYWEVKKGHDTNLTNSIRAVEDLYYREIEMDTGAMHAILHAVTRIKSVKKAFLSGDRKALYQQVLPLFEEYRNHHSITHFYFTGPDRVNFLRAHEPNRYGDIIDRHTTLQAVETGDVASGVELGPLGTLTLRVVMPWRDGDRLIGYLELGHEIGHFAEEIHEVLGIDMQLLLYKRALDRESWETGMKMLGNKAYWDQFPNNVIIVQTGQKIPAGVAEILETGTHPHMSIIGMEEARGGKLYVTFQPIFDVSGNEVGDFVIIRNVTKLLATFHKSVFIITLISILAGAIVFTLFYVILDRVEADVRRHAKGLSDEITIRKQTEEALKKSEATLYNAFEYAIIGKTLVASDHSIMRANNAFCEMLGYSEAELVGMFLNDITHPDDVEISIKHHKMLISGEIDRYQIEKRYLHKDGNIMWGLLSVSCVRDAQNNLLHAIAEIQDITERKKAEEEARQLRDELAYVERFSTMGEMAATLAHELNQPLAAISNYAQGCINRLRTGIGDTASLLSTMEKVYKQAGRAGDLISNVRSFVRKEQPQWTSVDVNHIVREIADLLAAEARLNQTIIVLELHKTLPWVKGNPIQIQQVILNLARNGTEAMKESDTSSRVLTITTSKHDDGMIAITVHDMGPGLPNGDNERLFTAFFTTKSHGLGLGLSICQSIITAHGGEIGFVSNGEMGTAIRFTLPHNNGDPPK